jgi:DNA-binding transcriptional MerR regulator
MPLSTHPAYNLKVVIKETGIGADTLRAWERRYGLPVPQRTAGGHRLYSQRDIETIRWLMARQVEGLSISRAVDMWKDGIQQGHDPLAATNPAPVLLPAGAGELDTLRRRWLEACLDFDENAAEQVITQAFALHPTETVCAEVLQRGISEIGELWYTGNASVQNEHFATALAVRRLDALIAAAPAPTRPQTVLIACPPGEWHTFSLIILTLLLRRRGLNVVYLGANVPTARLNEMFARVKPALVVLASQVLLSTATLGNTARQIATTGIPVAYGGRIFNVAPRLRSSIPGHFLGEDMQSALQTIEQLLTDTPPAPQIRLPAGEFLKLKEAFTRQRPLIEVAAMQKGLELADLHAENLEIANHYFGDNLAAALSLGDISLLESEMEWLGGLLTGRNLSNELVPAYLEIYAGAVEKGMGSAGQPVVDWIHDYLKK